VICLARCAYSIWCERQPSREDLMGSRFFVFALALALPTAIPAELFAQDVPGIEICTVEKAMDRRTSCLQSNVDFLQKTITRL